MNAYLGLDRKDFIGILEKDNRFRSKLAHQTRIFGSLVRTFKAVAI